MTSFVSSACRTSVLQHVPYDPYQLMPSGVIAGAMAMLAPRGGDEPDVEVRFEDQQHINEFGRLNTRLHEIQQRAGI
jgi:hypothetical protein